MLNNNNKNQQKKQVNFEKIPDELKVYRNWCCWRTELREGKPTKIPIDAKTGKNAECNNPETWSTYDKVVEYYEQNLKPHFPFSEAGIGFFFSDSDPYTGIDFDDCVKGGAVLSTSRAKRCVLNETALIKIEKLNSYTEFSPSLDGTHTIVRAVKTGEKCRTGKVDFCSHVEMYDKLRYFTFTGHVMKGYEKIKSRQKELTEFYNEIFKESEDTKEKQGKQHQREQKLKRSKTENLSDKKLIEKAMNAKNGEKFENLWTGNWQAEGYPSQSEADLALCELLAFWTGGDRERCDRLFRQSSLYRQKWDEKRGDTTYGEMTISEALSNQTEYYEPIKNSTKKENDRKEKNRTLSAETSDNDKKPKFFPTPIAKKLLAKRDYNLAYVTEQDIFYRYRNGVWEPIPDGYVEKSIRTILFETKSSWDRQNKRTEVFEALKDHLTDFSSRIQFDLGRNSNSDLINVKNGMLDWRTGELKPHDKEYYSTCQLSVEYSEEADSSLWNRCLRQWIPDKVTRLFVQEFSGYCLIPDTREHKAVILTGSGSNGKSVFLATLEALFGEDNLTNIPLEKLSERFETAKIQNKLVNICADIDPTYIEHTGIIKKIISGDTLRGENKYKPSFDFKSVARLWFSANEIPKSADNTEAWYRRFEIVNFPNRFTGEKRDTHLVEKLTKPETLSAVLNWGIKGLQRLEKQGEFTVSDDMIETKELYELENDSVSAFIDEMIEFPVDNAIPKTWLYERYTDYCDDTNLKGVSRRRFLQRVKAWGFEEEIKRIAVCKNHKNFRCQECISNDTKTKTARVFFGLEYRE